MSDKKKVVVVGGGFAGIQFVRKLDAKKFDVVLIDKFNHHQFQPLFYQVATSQLEPSSISFPLRHVFRRKENVQIRLGEVEKVDAENKKVETSIGDFEYDYLVLAMGCKTNFFGNKQIEEHALTLKTTYDAITIRNHILQIFEDIISAKEEDKEALLNLVIVGGGPTGVELSGAFSEIKNDILPEDYPRIDFSRLRIILVEGGADTLASMSEKAKKGSKEYLTNMGVEVLINTIVKNYDGQTVELSNGESIKSKTVIWSAGVIGNTLEGLPEELNTPGNRLVVNRYNQLESMENVYVLGDMARMQTPLYPNGHPQLANVAINQAKNLAVNLSNLETGKPLREYEYKDLGAMATVGRNKAVVDLPVAKFKGFFAWVFWMFLHLMLILSVKNKLIIFINWAWAYVTKNTALRLIIKDTNNDV